MINRTLKKTRKFTKPAYNTLKGKVFQYLVPKFFSSKSSTTALLDPEVLNSKATQRTFADLTRKEKKEHVFDPPKHNFLPSDDYKEIASDIAVIVNSLPKKEGRKIEEDAGVYDADHKGTKNIFHHDGRPLEIRGRQVGDTMRVGTAFHPDEKEGN